MRRSVVIVAAVVAVVAVGYSAWRVRLAYLEKKRATADLEYEELMKDPIGSVRGLRGSSGPRAKEILANCPEEYKYLFIDSPEKINIMNFGTKFLKEREAKLPADVVQTTGENFMDSFFERAMWISGRISFENDKRVAIETHNFYWLNYPELCEKKLAEMDENIRRVDAQLYPLYLQLKPYFEDTNVRTEKTPRG